MTWSDRYSPDEVEKRIYEWWQKNQCFVSKKKTSAHKVFSLVLPPPNVTGSLHLGHALNHTIQDCLVRWRRMQGDQAVWFPGTDHAGIATQIQVEKKLAKEGQSRRSLGREKFLEKVWEWKEKHGHEILEQMKRLGDSCDWSQFLFTLDPSSVRAVKKAFVHLYKKGWIYQGTKLVNWSTGLSSAISDLEVEYKEVQSHFYEVKYFLEDGQDFLIVSTTRPETILADQAVAVHPDDDRYKKYHGKSIKVPLTDRKVPIITDTYVDPKFGTGVLKITPAHDFNDYKIGKAHGLKELSILNANGKLNEHAGVYKGLKPLEARKKVVSDLEKEGLLKNKKPHAHQVGFCSRSGSVVEPFLSKQWFLKMDELARRGLQVVEKGEVELIPKLWVKTYKHWMSHIDDWCLSRQLWWGHQIPAWHCLDCKKVSVQEEDMQKCAHCSSTNIQQDEDVLDTWFSSALWPMSVLKWPDQDVKKDPHYPMAVLVTAPDILFFWVARMIMMGLEFQNQIPFKQVYLHGVVRDNQGRKMSKSLGNGEDPIDLINEYGSDALRLYLLYSHAMGRDILFSRETLKVCRNFMNKIWNATRLVDQITQNCSSFQKQDLNTSSPKLSPIDHWILYKLKETEKKVNQDLKEFRFSSACLQAYNFTWMEFCDWYLEWIKPDVYGTDEDRKKVICWVLSHILNHLVRLLHPFIPFITEEIYQKREQGNSVMLADLPTGDEAIFNQVKAESKDNIEFVKSIISAIRHLRGENNIKPSMKLKVQLLIPPACKKDKALVQNQEAAILFLAKLESLDIVSSIDNKSFSATMSLEFNPDMKIHIPLEGVVDVQGEVQRIEKKVKKLEGELSQLNHQLSSDSFVSKAPPDLVQSKKDRVKEVNDLLKNLKDSLRRLQKM